MPSLGKSHGSERRLGRRHLKYHWRKTWREWMDRRLPPASRVGLNHKNVFISPTKAGFAFLGLTVILLLIAINFQNSAVYALTFLLMAVFVVSILHTFSNLSGIVVSSIPCEPVFSGRDALFYTRLNSPNGLKHYSVQLSWQNNFSDFFDVEPDRDILVDLRFKVGPRGICFPGRLKVESCYPFGLLSARTYVDVQHHTVVYPHPFDFGNLRSPATGSYEEGPIEQAGSDDFYGLREYQTGDRVRDIAWRNYAKNDRLAIKQFVDLYDEHKQFDWFQLHGNTEDRLSQLCQWVLDAESASEKYGLIMPNIKIPPSSGKQHLQSVLTTLAFFGLDISTLESYQQQNNISLEKNNEAAEAAASSGAGIGASA